LRTLVEIQTAELSTYMYSVGSVTNVELRKSDNKHYYNDAQSESPYKCGMEREDETLTTGIMYLPRVLPNGTQGQVLGY
jgi:hypothetical protein